MAVKLNGLIRFRRQFPTGLKTFPCQRNSRASQAMIRAQIDPGQAIAVPAASPSGIGPAGLAANSTSSSFAGVRRRVRAVRAMDQVLRCLDDRWSRRAPTGSKLSRLHGTGVGLKDIQAAMLRLLSAGK